MDVLAPMTRIVLGVLAYLGFAILALVGVRRIGRDLKEMADRTSSAVLAIGAAANVGALLAVLLLIELVDRKALASLGLSLSARDLAVSLGAAAAAFVFASGFVRLRGRDQSATAAPTPPTPPTPARPGRAAPPPALGILVLALVALQEELLYRGYVTLNLVSFGWPVVVVGSTAIFVLIHFLTNRASVAQVLSWVASGMLLIAAYLFSGSIWVPVILHFAIDLSNVVVLDITGRSSRAGVGRLVSDRDRAVFRVGFAAVVIGALVVGYGAQVAFL